MRKLEKRGRTKSPGRKNGFSASSANIFLKGLAVTSFWLLVTWLVSSCSAVMWFILPRFNTYESAHCCTCVMLLRMLAHGVGRGHIEGRIKVSVKKN